MSDVRCECGKKLCQSDHEYIVIKCRHCKRIVFIRKDDAGPKSMTNPHFVDRTHTQLYSKHV